MQWLRLAPAWAWMLIAIHSITATASRLTPPVLPLFVRNPYFSTWMGNARDNPWSKWPMFYTSEELGMSLMAHVPSTGKVYPLVGRPHDSLSAKDPEAGYSVAYPTYLGANYDASTTNLSYVIPPAATDGVSLPLEITLSFFSPITPPSTLRQSIPASYMTAFVNGNVNVNLYMDLNGQWVTGDRGNVIEWDHTVLTPKDGEDTLQTWHAKRQVEQLFTEYSDHAEWGSLYFTAPTGVHYESGESGKVRPRFASSGTLQDTNDDEFRAVMDREPIFAFSKSFALNEGSGRASKRAVADSVTFTAALVQDPVVQFAAARGLTYMRPLWRSWFPEVEDLLSFHYYDLPAAASLATDYSSGLAVDAFQSAAEDYVDIVALSARQVLGATVFSGNAENPVIFLKEISSNGNSQTIDVIFPSFPFFLYSNPRWLAYLLEPLYEHMLSGQYPNTYAMHDLGYHFPNITGHPDGNDEYMPLEECGNMLIMALAVVNSLRFLPDQGTPLPWQPDAAYQQQGDDVGLFPLLDLRSVNGIAGLDHTWGLGQKANDNARKWVERSYSLLKQWTGYLVEFSLTPQNQLSTDDFVGWLALQTNLALKGIVGINAMSKLADVVGEYDDAEKYKNISDTYISKWEGYGMSRDGSHGKLSYNWYGSWTTLYNMFADAVLCFHLEGTEDEVSSYRKDGQTRLKVHDDENVGFVPRSVYLNQSSWYHYVRQKYGVPLDSRHLFTKSDWEFFSMAVSSPFVRHEILESVARWVNETVTTRPLTDLYMTEGDGGYPTWWFYARPVVGGHFAFLALEKACNGKAMDGLNFLDDQHFEDEHAEDELHYDEWARERGRLSDQKNQAGSVVDFQGHDGSQVKMGFDTD